ncbi:MAG: amino acid racemase [Spirochaetia bacterium]|nr:amino acid racemase [Spirochaetia bacterium]
MRLVGLIGGMSWESTAEYYRIVNDEIAARLGALSSARLLLSSVDFGPIAAAMKAGDWGSVREALVGEALRLRMAGVEALALATNTMHRFAADLEAECGLPLIHIADAAATAIKAAGFRRAGLLGTVFTMEEAFYRDRLRERHGIEVIVPERADRLEVDRCIFGELCRGVIDPRSAARLKEIAASLAEAGAEGIILGCTELPLAMRDGDLAVPYWDTTLLHARALVDFMLEA